ncbi:MAG: DNA recombination protein RmuC [Alphaproteobacteria bacterium]|nr:DNA recombination protein RmuC [Alphaproteobacteria bacterium]
MMQLALESWIYLGGVAAILVVLVVLALRKPQAAPGVDQERLNELRAERDEWRATAESAAQETARAQASIARLETALEAERAHHAEKLQALEAARKTLDEAFEQTAQRVLKASGAELQVRSTETLTTLLKPLREQLDGFRKQVVEDSEKRVGQTSALHQLVQTLHADARTMSSEAKNLANALRSQAKLQGDWGEMVLASILEKAGLREGSEFQTQTSETGPDGSRLRPDVVVAMPNNQRLVIDSKVSLTAFERCVNAETDEDRAAALRAHLASVRAHIRSLGDKDYAQLYEGVSFTLMFIPLEGAASLALQNDPELAAFAWERDVMIATPTTLMMAMRTVHNLWTIDRQNQNARAIAQRAGLLYDKFEGFLTDLDKVGDQINRARGSWEDARKKLVDGRGNLVSQVETLKKLGASTKKRLGEDWLDAAGEDETDEAGAPPTLEDGRS